MTVTPENTPEEQEQDLSPRDLLIQRIGSYRSQLAVMHARLLRGPSSPEEVECLKQTQDILWALQEAVFKCDELLAHITKGTEPPETDTPEQQGMVE